VAQADGHVDRLGDFGVSDPVRTEGAQSQRRDRRA
jgi:hypothetical protein